MKNIRKYMVIGLVVLFIGLTFIPSSNGVKSENTTSIVRNSNSYIQDLIDDASEGDTIYIPSGIYYEHICINKSINLVGENKDTTIIDGGLYDAVIFIYANWVNISGFTIQNGLQGVYIYRVNYISITDINIDWNEYFYGINAYHSNYIAFFNNNISNNNYGIALTDCNYSIIAHNKIKDNNEHGIWLHDSSNISILFNYIMGGLIQDLPSTGILIAHSSNNNTVAFNTITNYNLVSIFIDNSFNNEISYNSIVNNNGTGIELFEAYYNEFIRNDFSNNNEGIGLYFSNNNQISSNNFIDNGRDAFFKDSFSNFWNQNYWNKPRIIPKFIIGRIGYLGLIPWINIDWSPAKKPHSFDQSEDASVVVREEISKIKMTLTTGGQNYPSNGYSFEASVIIRLNGTILAETSLEGNIGWEVGESLYIGGKTPILDDEESAVGPLGLGTYSVTITIIETVIYDDDIIIV